MRERSTWNREFIASGRKSAATPMDTPEHLQQQKPSSAYSTGGPSEFGEDVHAEARWKSEYEGGETARNEIGMPEMRSDSLSKAAAQLDAETVTKKANLCVKVARKMLPKSASEQTVEDQAYSLMHLPDAELLQTATRLAADAADKGADDEEEDEDEDQGKQAADAADKGADDEEEDEGQQAKQGGQIPPQFLENVKKKKEEAKDKDDDKKDEKKEAAKKASDLAQLAASALQSGDQQGLQAAVQQMVQSMLQQQQMAADAAQQPQQQQQMAADAGQQQQVQSQQQLQQMIQGMVEQACQQQMGQQQPQQQQMGQQQMGQPQQQMADDQLLDQMLMDQGQGQQMMMSANNDIQIDGPQMDVGASADLGHDDVLNSLFASNQEYQNAVEAQNLTTGMPVQASAPVGMTRTASTRTVGTRPSGGVSQLGGVSGGNTGDHNEINKLSNMWASAPDVRKHFG